ncbi:hypothetical protein H0N99_01355 [Candidatus Micrarchaeota archaeon]|nr:hypothetical protein [Candidatus Micrarchaeota archaeon]
MEKIKNGGWCIMTRVITLIILMAFILPVFAVECPPGFHWERMSGVGCVQDDCAAKGGGYTYTKECWCGDTVRACYGAVNYSGFDAKKCSSFCPISKFIGCADANGKCPNDKPTQPGCQYHNPDCAEGYQCTNNVCSPTQEYCDDYCIRMEGPHATATIQNNICQCGCEEGYTNENSDVLLCQPTKATCDAYCKSYHGGGQESR